MTIHGLSRQTSVTGSPWDSFDPRFVCTHNAQDRRMEPMEPNSTASVHRLHVGSTCDEVDTRTRGPRPLS
jgi:hypothetical protein